MPPRRTLALLLLSYFAFISLGLPDAIDGVAWPAVRETFDQPIGQLGWLGVTGMIGYVSTGFFAGWLTARIGIGRLLLASSFSIVCAQLGYALAPNWATMVAIGLLSGIGAGAIDSAINAFAAHRFSHRVMNWIHACYGIGATLGPMLMTLVLAMNWSWRIGYGILSGIIAVMCVGFAMTLRLWDEPPGDSQLEQKVEAPPVQRATLAAAIRRPMVWAQIALFFFYTGLEASIGKWAASLLIESRGVDIRTAGITVGVYWACLTAGRIAFGALAHHFKSTVLIRIALMCSPICAGVICLRIAPAITIVAIAALGFFLAPIFPMLMSLTPSRVGPAFAQHSIGFQISAAALGAAAISGTAGALAQEISLEAIPRFLFGVAVVVTVIYFISSISLESPEEQPQISAD